MVEVTACGSITQGCCDDGVESGEKLNVPATMVSQLAAMGIIKDPDPKSANLVSKEIPPSTLSQILEQMRCEPKPTGLFVADGPLCGLPVFYIEKTNSCVAFNKATKLYENIDMSGVGQNPSVKNSESRRLNIEVHAPAGAGDITHDNASLIAKFAGATFPSGAAADDVANVYLHSMQATLAHVGDESVDGTSTTCDAEFVDGQTSEVVNLEPGGPYPLEASACTDVPAFKMVVKDGSTVRFCLDVSQELDKAGVVVPK